MQKGRYRPGGRISAGQTLFVAATEQAKSLPSQDFYFVPKEPHPSLIMALLAGAIFAALEQFLGLSTATIISLIWIIVYINDRNKELRSRIETLESMYDSN